MADDRWLCIMSGGMSQTVPYVRVASLKSAEAFRGRLSALGIELEFDETLEAGPEAPLARPCRFKGRTIGNRFCVLPMEGWDGTPQGEPSDLTLRRCRRFGHNGAKLIWGGEADVGPPPGPPDSQHTPLPPRHQTPY